jgi:hypothetical protein
MGLGSRLLARALSDCYSAGRTFAFVAVILDCVDLKAKAFYQHWDFQELPGNPLRLFLSAKVLEALMRRESSAKSRQSLMSACRGSGSGVCGEGRAVSDGGCAVTA